MEFNAPCRTTKYPREVPPLPWYRQTVPQMLMAGFLPFSAIYIELYYIFASVWGHKVYTIYPILFIVFIILVIVTAFITIALTYFQLAVEDHRWWWRSFMCGGSTGTPFSILLSVCAFHCGLNPVPHISDAMHTLGPNPLSYACRGRLLVVWLLHKRQLRWCDPSSSASWLTTSLVLKF